MVPQSLAKVGRVATIGVVHIGWHGHVGPANRLTAVLAAGGHRVVAWAPPDFHRQIADAGAEPRSLPWRMPSDNDGSAAQPSPLFHRPPPQPDGPVAMAIMHGIHELALGLAVYTLTVGEELTAAAHAEDLDLMVHDAMAPWGRVAAEWLGLPRLVAYPGFPPPFAVDVPPISAELDGQLAVARQAVAQRWGVEFGGSLDMLVSFGDATATFTTPEIAGQEAVDPSWRMVGPLMEAIPAGPPVHLSDDDDRPLVYMALGTVHNWRADVFRAGIDALADEDVRLLVSTGGRLGPETFEPLPPNVTVVTYVPSRAVLSHAALHITHGGANSVHESLAAGVPMVCLPQGDDHHLWAERVRALGAGAVVAAEPEAIRAAVVHVLADDATRGRADDVAQHLRDFPGEATVTATVAELLD
jgi:MGT family glycosyltransferase